MNIQTLFPRNKKYVSSYYAQDQKLYPKFTKSVTTKAVIIVKLMVLFHIYLKEINEIRGA